MKTKQKAKQRFYILTYGCQMNKSESQRISDLLSASGQEPVAKIGEADLIIINSCSVRQGSEDKVYGLGQKIMPLKRSGRGPKVILIGCMVGSAEGDRRRYKLSKLKHKIPWVDEFLSFEELLEKFGEKVGGGVVGGVYMVPISQGCDNFCTYCAVPYGRGKEVSRPEEEILCEIEKAVEAGHAQIMLLGQNVNSYGLGKGENHREELPFSRLLKKVHGIKGVKKVSFLTLNPYDINNDLMDTLALPKIDRYIHLPVQSGDDKILKLMNRHYTVEEYKDIVAKMRARIPGVRIGTDIIVGFPGETKEQFENTLKLVREVGFKQIFVGIYSERKGTAAAKFEDNVPLVEKKRRHRKVMQAWENAGVRD